MNARSITKPSEIAPTQRPSSQHEVLAATKVQGFDQWMDEQLAELETRFEAFVTRQSVKHSLNR